VHKIAFSNALSQKGNGWRLPTFKLPEANLRIEVEAFEEFLILFSEC